MALKVASLEAAVKASLAPAASTSASLSRQSVVSGLSFRGQNGRQLGGLTSAGVSSRSLALGGKKIELDIAQPRRMLPVSATAVVSKTMQSTVDIPKLAEELDSASPLEIMDKALSLFGDDIAIAFSGAEDVALIEYAHLTGRPFRVFSLETGRLNPETLKLFDDVEKRYNIRIQYMYPDAAEVEELTRTKGLFSFYEDGHQECCRVRKVRPLRRALKGLNAWITGQRKDQSPGTRANVPVVQVDPAFEGLGGGPGSLVKWNPLSNVSGTAVWSFLRTMDVPVNALHFKGYVSIGCEPCTRAVLPGQHEREGRWWWEDAKAKECGLHKGNLDGVAESSNSLGEKTEVADLFTSENVVTFGREDMEALAKGENRDKSSLVVLYAPWCSFSQAMDESYNAVAEKLAGSNVVVGKFNADGAQKAYAKENLQLQSYPTILFLPKNSCQIIKYPSENREVDALLGFVQALQ